MKNLQLLLALLLAMSVIASIIGCSGGIINEVSPAPTLTSIPTQMATPSIPTYSQVVRTYAANANLCTTECTVIAETQGEWLLEVGEGQRGIEIINNKPQVQCYGTKVKLNVSVIIDGKTYQAGAKLTVDKDMNWIEVSSWD